MFEVLPVNCEQLIGGRLACDATHASTLEKSAVGDMTKLSALADHEIRCWMLGSSSMLRRISHLVVVAGHWLPILHRTCTVCG